MQVLERFPLAPISFISDKVPESDKELLSSNDGIVKDTSNIYMGIDTDKKILDHVLKSLRKKAAFDQIVTEYPSLNDAAIKMANYFSLLAPALGELPLVSKCLLNGINAFNLAHKQSYMINDPSIKMSAFIMGVSNSFHEILFNNIYGRYENSWVQWKPLTEPILEWVLRYQFQQVLIVPSSSRINAETYEAASNKLLYEVFNFSDLSYCSISSVKAMQAGVSGTSNNFS